MAMIMILSVADIAAIADIAALLYSLQWPKLDYVYI